MADKYELFRLRVHLGDGGIERVTLPCRPDSVPQLTALLREKLEVPYSVLVQLEDPDFGGQLCNLSSTHELQNMGTEGTSQDPAAIKRPAAIISVIDDDVLFHPGRVYVVLEEKVVMKNFRCWPDALLCLYRLMYSLQHGYPNRMKNTFGFIQKVLLNLDRDRMKPKI
ncbi:unnamed protein product [Coregonus sp. 'balchen']|nr:unnamed protein product [Coregonus sp. 'balchen']